jgi:CubicO group peptidase (beta-lactamase class C family)
MYARLFGASILALSAASAWDAPAPHSDIFQLYSGQLRPDEEVRHLMHSDALLPSNRVAHGAHARPLPAATHALRDLHFTSGGKSYDLHDFLALDRVAGLLVLKDGRVAYEDYELGANPGTHWFSASVAKSITSTLVGASVQDKSIASLDDPISRYLPVMNKGAYAAVTIRQALQMASGVQWDEDYAKDSSDRRQLLNLQLAQKPGSMLQYMSERKRATAAGTLWHYNTGEAFVVGAAVEAATHKSLAQYLSEKVWKPWGMESDATWWAESPGGTGFGGGGMSATLRDYARFGLFAMNDGVINGQRVVPAGWFDEAGSRKKLGETWVDYGYFWWIPPQEQPLHAGAFESVGIFGQYVYVNRREKVVIAVLGAQPKAEGMEPVAADDFFAAVVQALHTN